MITFLTVFILTHVVKFSCGRKQGRPEKTHDFRQSIGTLFLWNVEIRNAKPNKGNAMLE
jgi:hypothetical protein